MRADVSGPFEDFGAVRDAIAHAIAGADVALNEVSRAPAPDLDGFGGTHVLVIEGQGVRIEEVIASGQYGSPRDGYGYDMRWTITGTGARSGARATFFTSNHEPKALGFTLEVTDAEGPAVIAALTRLTGRAPRIW